MPFLTTTKSGTAESLAPCTRSITPPLIPPSPGTRGLPNAGVLLGHAQSASKSICSSGALLSSEYRLGTRVASSAEISRALESESGFDSGALIVKEGDESGPDAGGFWIGERCTESDGGGW